MANTDERLKAIAEIRKDIPATLIYCRNITLPIEDVEYAAQEALKARDALRRIREATEMGQTFASAVSRRVLRAMVELIDKVLAD